MCWGSEATYPKGRISKVIYPALKERLVLVTRDVLCVVGSGRIIQGLPKAFTSCLIISVLTFILILLYNTNVQTVGFLLLIISMADPYKIKEGRKLRDPLPHPGCSLSLFTWGVAVRKTGFD